MAALRKRRTREHIIADLSVNHVERFILKRGHTAERQVRSDYGYDLTVSTYDETGERETGIVYIQLRRRTPLEPWTMARQLLSRSTFGI